MTRLRDERGFALIAALWLMVALSVVGLEFGLRARSRRLSVANAVEQSAFRAAAEGALEQTHARLGHLAAEARAFGTTDSNLLLDPWGVVDTTLADTLRHSAGAMDGRADGPTVSITLEDAGAKLNLNLATEEELRRFFRALRVDYGEADRLAQAIADWRDVDRLHRARGAEREDYLRAKAEELPADAPFTRLDELRFVRGVTSQLYAQVQPYLTLVGTGRINVNAAPRPVLLALPGLTEEAATVLERRRQSHSPIRSLDQFLVALSEGPRAAIQAESQALQSRIIFETQEVVATAVGALAASPVRVQVRGLFVRSGDAVFLVWRRVD